MEVMGEYGERDGVGRADDGGEGGQLLFLFLFFFFLLALKSCFKDLMLLMAMSQA
jgi:hypothetical protein